LLPAGGPSYDKAGPNFALFSFDRKIHLIYC